MKKRRGFFAGIILVILAICSCGCALISTAISAGISYGIYKATKK